jgi:hypothetical protein
MFQPSTQYHKHRDIGFLNHMLCFLHAFIYVAATIVVAL